MAQEDAELRAYPCAEGWGAASRGGRGGKLIKVTNLNASGPGSLAEACATDGPRIIIFEVSGVIRGDIRITSPYITIAGQTAPGAGITVEGVVSSYDYGVRDIIIRYLRVRPRRDIGAGGDCMAPYRENAASDFCNNLVYNCRGGYVDDGHGVRARSPVNLYKNYYRRIVDQELLVRRATQELACVALRANPFAILQTGG